DALLDGSLVGFHHRVYRHRGGGSPAPAVDPFQNTALVTQAPVSSPTTITRDGTPRAAPRPTPPAETERPPRSGRCRERCGAPSAGLNDRNFAKAVVADGPCGRANAIVRDARFPRKVGLRGVRHGQHLQSP